MFLNAQLIYDIGEDPSHFYIILSGRIDLWSHPAGAHRCAVWLAGCDCLPASLACTVQLRCRPVAVKLTLWLAVVRNCTFLTQHTPASGVTGLVVIKHHLWVGVGTMQSHLPGRCTQRASCHTHMFTLHCTLTNSTSTLLLGVSCRHCTAYKLCCMQMHV